ncbi:hypothetical protein NDN08_004861 [Rhodosorus marinus]|uniref:Methanethiol oxidase n=1 Tax=Rhodosorus marinus TaxID=101924 RepID=A0AAV8UGA8_9RHOD|nr:hypothetical protein NDN08_004861 [Rhodosorus marinus]
MAAAEGNIAIVGGTGQETIIGLDGTTLKTISFVEEGSQILSLLTFNNTIYAASYQFGDSTVGEISAYDVLFDDVGWGPSVAYDVCTDPTDLSATFDEISTPRIMMTCAGASNTLVVDPVSLELVKSVPKPVISGLTIVKPVSVAAAGEFMYVAYETKYNKPTKSKGLLVQYNIMSFEMMGHTTVTGPSIHLLASPKRGLFMTTSGFGKSQVVQMDLKTMTTETTLRGSRTFFTYMSITPDQKTLYVSFGTKNGTTGGIRSFDLTSSPVQQLCKDAPVQALPANASVVMSGSVYVLTNNSVTKFELNYGNKCPLRSSAISVVASQVGTNVITSMCSECPPPMS